MFVYMNKLSGTHSVLVFFLHIHSPCALFFPSSPTQQPSSGILDTNVYASHSCQVNIIKSRAENIHSL